jgi:hypothetical protein
MAKDTKGSASVARCIWEAVGLRLIMASYGRHVSVSARLDQLMNETFVADLGYPADPSMVARVVRGLQLLADEIDAIDAHVKDAQAHVKDAQAHVKDAHVKEDLPSSVAPEPPAQGATTAHVDQRSPIGLE